MLFRSLSPNSPILCVCCTWHTQVELEHELERARNASANEHRAERCEWERRVAELESRLDTLAADRNAVSASLEQANFRLWSRAHDAHGDGGDNYASASATGAGPWGQRRPLPNDDLVSADDGAGGPPLTWAAGRRPAPRPLRADLWGASSGASESEADENPRVGVPKPSPTTAAAGPPSRLASAGSGGARGAPLRSGPREPSTSMMMPATTAAAAAALLGLTRPVGELDTETAAATLHALTQDLLRSSAGVI
jgi:hypothetical protein